MNRRMKIIFTVSLLLNIALMGTGAGLLYHFCRDAPVSPDMSPEARSFVARTYQEGRADVRTLIEEIKARKKKVEAILMADTFDPAAYDAAVEDVLETQGQIMRHRAATMSRALEKLSVEDRRKFSRQILDGLSHKRRAGRGRHEPHRDNQPETGRTEETPSAGPQG